MGRIYPKATRSPQTKKGSKIIEKGLMLCCEFDFKIDLIPFKSKLCIRPKKKSKLCTYM